MFPNKSGGIALYAHEAWRKYLTVIGPARDLRLLDRLVGRARDQRARRRLADPGGVVRGQAPGPTAAPASTSRCRSLLGIGADHPRVGLQRLRGAARRSGSRYVTGGLLLHSGRRADVPARTSPATGRARTWSGTSARAAGWRWPWSGCTSCAGRRTGSRSWPASRPSTRTPSATPARALRGAALFSGVVYALLPLGIGGTLGTQTISDGAATLSFYGDAFDALVALVPRQRDDRVRRRGADPVDEQAPRWTGRGRCTASPRTG